MSASISHAPIPPCSQLMSGTGKGQELSGQCDQWALQAWRVPVLLVTLRC